MRLSFRASVYGCAALVCVLLSRILSVYLTLHPVRTVFFLDPLNYLLTTVCILLLLRATALAATSVKKMRYGRNILAVIQIFLILELLYQSGAQVLHFTLDININESLFVTAFASIISFPSVCGLYALYFSKLLRSKVQYYALGLFWASVGWNVLRIFDKVMIPLFERYTAIPQQTLQLCKAIAGINDEFSFLLFV